MDVLIFKVIASLLVWRHWRGGL